MFSSNGYHNDGKPFCPEHEDRDADTGVLTYTKDNFDGFGWEEFPLKVRAVDAMSACLWRGRSSGTGVHLPFRCTCLWRGRSSGTGVHLPLDVPASGCLSWCLWFDQCGRVYCMLHNWTQDYACVHVAAVRVCAHLY